MLSRTRRLLKLIHPEGIPWPGTVFYNAISRSLIFQKNYSLVAKDIVSRCPEGSILDIGTGPGWLLVHLRRRSGRLRLTGLDISPAMTAKARKNLAEAGLKDIRIETGSASGLPFPDESFDAVVSTGSIHHWKEPVRGLNEVYRVLKKGGHALMYDLVSDTPRFVLDEVSIKFGRLRSVLLRIHALDEPFYTWKDFESLARETLFRSGITRFVGVQCCLYMNK